MALAVQTHRGDVDNASSYASAADMRAYHGARGTDLTSYTDTVLEQKLVLATDFMDARYAFIGSVLRPLQGTQCPRYLDGGRSGDFFANDIHTLEPAHMLTTPQWQVLVKACCMLAYRALTKPTGLMPDPTFDATGLAVKSRTTEAGPIKSAIVYQDASSFSDSVPSYPAVDLLLKNAGLTRSRSGGSLSRA